MIKSRVVIFANGTITQPDSIMESILPDDILIAADGGTHHLIKLGVIPHIVVGDFDSLDEYPLSNLKKRGVELIHHPAEKDETDLELALSYACRLGTHQVLIFGALGGRWDMSFANVMLLFYPNLSWGRGYTIQVTIQDGNRKITLITPKTPLDLRGKEGDIVSLIPIAGNAQGVVTLGLAYPLQAETLIFGATRGLSNVMLQEHARVTLQAGNLLCFIENLA